MGIVFNLVQNRSMKIGAIPRLEPLADEEPSGFRVGIGIHSAKSLSTPPKSPTFSALRIVIYLET